MGGLRGARSLRVWMTCQQFTDVSSQDCRSLLVFALQQRLVSHGEHLTKTCRNGMVRRELEIGWFREEA